MHELPQVGPWAREKLDHLRRYLVEYTKILSKQPWCEQYIYIDAFAGSGKALLRENRKNDPTNAFLDLGREFRLDPEDATNSRCSPRVALDIEPPFTQYVFLELNKQRRGNLESAGG